MKTPPTEVRIARPPCELERALNNARVDVARFKQAARETFGSERAKYLQGVRNLEGYISVQESRLSKGERYV